MKLIKKTFCLSLIFFWGFLLTTLPLSHGALPQHYKEKKVFYDSLSIVLNKYIKPVGNWGLFEGALHGLQKHLGVEQFALKSNPNLIEISIKDHSPLLFFRKQIDTNAIELVDSISKVFDSVFLEYEELDKTDIVHAAIGGMVATLEPNSYFIHPEDLTRLKAQSKGVYEGIGLEITTRDGAITVVSPYGGSPAFNQGLKPNDRIIAVDGISTNGLSILEVSGKIRGEKGSTVTLTIERQGWNAPRDIVLVRDTISHKTISSFLLEPGFGYIRIINFLGTTCDDFKAALESFTGSAQLEGLVIDLRYNPGGLLNQSLGLVDFFLNTGIIATTEGRIKSDNKTYYAKPGTLANDYPIVIIINNGSASGSEILASSLRSHQRAILVGEKSFGKGFVQAIFPIQTGGCHPADDLQTLKS